MLLCIDDRRMLLACSIFWFKIVFVIISRCSGSFNTITVALSERKPFVLFDHDGTPKGLDVSIVENFATKFNLQIVYYIANSTQYISANHKHSDFLLERNLFGYLKE